MKLKRIVIFLAMLSVAVFSIGMATPAAAANLPLPTPPFHQCPAIGLDTGCAVLIVQNSDGSIVTLVDPLQRPFDGIEDTLVGFQNNSDSTVSSLALSGSSTGDAAFSFDRDGICEPLLYDSWIGKTGCPFLDSVNRYGGPFVTFSGISSNLRSGTVNFTPAIPVGGSTYFSLEGPTSSIAPPTKASPTITTLATNSALGGTISDTATLAGGAAPTGTITFKLFGPNDATCTLLASTSTKTVTGNGPYTSAAFTPLLLGTYRWVANYSGDVNNNPANTACGASGETSTVTKASPTITTQATSATAGGAISDTATLTGGFAPTGTITFNLFGPNNSTCTLQVFTSTKTVSGNGNYTSASFTALPAATYRWVATYSGDADNNPANTACGASGETSTVTKASPTITTQATATATVGDTISDTATLSGGTAPTGTITFNLFGPNNPSCTLLAFTSTRTVSGNGNYTSDPFFVLPPGTYRWVASYSGDANNSPANTACGASGETSIVTFFFAPGGGSFVIGDENAAVGNSVTFWGAQWAKDNSLSGGSAPRSFKGFAENPTTPTCGAGWSADPGNSTPPPDGPLPAFMGVIVTSSADKSGSTISGNTVHIVIVKTDPGYAPNPGHAGTGTVVVGVC